MLICRSIIVNKSFKRSSSFMLQSGLQLRSMIPAVLAPPSRRGEVCGVVPQILTTSDPSIALSRKLPKARNQPVKLMKKNVISLLLVAATSTFFAGCTAVSYHKSVVTTLDANGKPVSTVITESITEPHQEIPRFPAAQGVELKHISQ